MLPSNVKLRQKSQFKKATFIFVKKYICILKIGRYDTHKKKKNIGRYIGWSLVLTVSLSTDVALLEGHDVLREGARLVREDVLYLAQLLVQGGGPSLEGDERSNNRTGEAAEGKRNYDCGQALFS